MMRGVRLRVVFMSQSVAKTVCSLLAALSVAVISSGCASKGAAHRPVVTNDDLINYESDLARCQEQAKNYQSEDQLKGGVLGALTGALAGIGEGTEETIAGAAIGAVIGAAGGSFKTKTKQREIVVECMRNLGYNVRD